MLNIKIILLCFFINILFTNNLFSYGKISIVLNQNMDFSSMSINSFMGLPATSTATITVHYDPAGTLIVDSPLRSMSISNGAHSINISLGAPTYMYEFVIGQAVYSIQGTMVNSVEPSSGAYTGTFSITASYK